MNRSTDDTLGLDVVRLLTARGIHASYEYPGAVVIRVVREGGDLAIWTGLTGWDYGTVSVLVDDEWEPTDEVVAEPRGVEEHDEDADRIARAWASWIRRITP